MHDIRRPPTQTSGRLSHRRPASPKHRETLGLTQDELAHRSGLSRNQVQNLENNRNNSCDAEGQRGPANPRLDTLRSVASVLEISLPDLVADFDAL